MTDAQVDFTTQFETVYDLLSEHDHDALRQVLRDRLSVVEDTGRSCGDVAVAPSAESLFLVCRMNVASSTRRVSSVSIRHDDQLNFKVDTSLGTYNVQGPTDKVGTGLGPQG